MPSPRHKRRPADATAAESASPPDRGALVGYARVSTDEQPRASAGRARSSRLRARLQGRRVGIAQAPPELDACIDYLRAGDTLVVWRLDRLGRGLKHLIEAIEQLHTREIGFRSRTDAIDTTTNAGMLQSTSSAHWRSSRDRPSASAPAPA
jgi:DNA invertase Pin-like site-specific DNA recombinase